jgi:hypothetical protein
VEAVLEPGNSGRAAPAKRQKRTTKTAGIIF